MSAAGTDYCTVKTVKGEWCHFPFTYKGKIYKGCTDVNHKRPWCSTTKNYDQDGLWGICAAGKLKLIKGYFCFLVSVAWCHRWLLPNVLAKGYLELRPTIVKLHIIQAIHFNNNSSHYWSHLF